VAIWSTVEPGIGITASCVATLRPLVRKLKWNLGIGSSGPALPSPYYPSISAQKRRDRRGYRRSLSPSDLVPTRMTCTTSTQIQGPERSMRPSQDYSLKSLPPIIVTDEDGALLEPGRIMQTTTLQQEYYEGVPRLQLRNSFRNSFTRGSILSLGRLCHEQLRN
jgi:hypothetical protein